MTPTEAFTTIKSITSELIRVGLSEEQNYPTKRGVQGGGTSIAYVGFNDISIALRNTSYEEIYNTLESSKQYNIKLIDGGLIQLLYYFEGKSTLKKHNLAYFPSPSFEPFQNDPDMYLDDSVFFTDMIQKSILPIPVRFDYDPNPNAVIDIEHPASHMTLGQYKKCRIPVSSPICPSNFVMFILRSFYNTAVLGQNINFKTQSIPASITRNETKCVHVSIP
ncbi:DUF2290 domain-containing protein [Vibrio parahaemolyticus]|nr:DUF2290 domain-containing protein [Vibrio parahaemolyticus]